MIGTHIQKSAKRGLSLPFFWHKTRFVNSKNVVCTPDPAPGVRSESGYFRILRRRCGDGTEGEIDGGDHRILTRSGGSAGARRDGRQDLPGCRALGADLLQVAS